MKYKCASCLALSSYHDHMGCSLWPACGGEKAHSWGSRRGQLSVFWQADPECCHTHSPEGRNPENDEAGNPRGGRRRQEYTLSWTWCGGRSDLITNCHFLQGERGKRKCKKPISKWLIFLSQGMVLCWGLVLVFAADRWRTPLGAVTLDDQLRWRVPTKTAPFMDPSHSSHASP